MKYVQNIRGNWTVRMVVPEELRHIIGRNELVQIGLPDNAKAREKMAIGVVKAFQALLDEAREVWDSLREASIPTLSTAAKEHFRSELALDDLERAAPKQSTDADILRNGRSTYASRLRLLAQGKLDDDEAEALIGFAANSLRREGRAPSVPRRELLRVLAEVQIEALERFEARDEGKVQVSEPRHSLLNEPDPVPKTMPGQRQPEAGGLTLSSALIAFHKERTAGGGTLAAKTMEEHKNAVRMTAHRSKGLEFDHVVILNGGWKALSKGEDGEAPRRLFYVAMTRARRSLAVVTSGEHAFVEADSESEVLRKVETPLRSDLPAPEQYQLPDLASVDLSYAGRLPQTSPVHTAIGKARVDDPVTLDLREGKWMILDADRRVLGRMASNWAPPEGTVLVSGKVGAIVRWRKSDSDESYHSYIRHEDWETVLPELVFRNSRPG